MEICTKNHDPSWDRTLYLYTEKRDGISELIHDKDSYKLLVLDEGSLAICMGQIKKVVTAPALILLTDEEVSFSKLQNVKSTTVYFRPTEIREEFTLERIQSGEFEEKYGSTVYQDYLLVKTFEKKKDGTNRIYMLSLASYSKIGKTIEHMQKQLQEQYDGYWPCRSRSYMMELLYYISYICEENQEDMRVVQVREESESDFISEILQYLSLHISERLSLEDIMKEFSINRNKLNAMFIKETSMTCMNYLTKMRVNLAQIMLAETELRIGEIADRVGYPDANYFVKVFTRQTGVTPSKYRKSFS